MDDDDRVSDAPLHLLAPWTKLNKEAKLKILKSGLEVKCGKFTEEEDKILRRNWKRFKREHKVSSQDMFGFFCHKAEEKAAIEHRRHIKKLIKNHKFYLRLAKNLPNRTIASIYQRCRKLKGRLKKATDLNDDDKNEVVKIRQTEYLNWNDIGLRVGCDPRSAFEIARNRINLHGKELKKGDWTDEEDQLLIDFIKKELDTENVTKVDTSLVKWEDIGHITNRGGHACYVRWRKTLRRKIREDGTPVRCSNGELEHDHKQDVT